MKCLYNLRKIWTPDELYDLATLAKSMILEELADHFGASKNQVSYQCTKNAIVLRYSRKKILPRKARNGSLVPRRKIYNYIDPPEPIYIPKPMKLRDRKEGQCSWIIGEPANQKCCGSPCQSNSSFCPDHHRVVYVKPKIPDGGYRNG